jgi:ATP-binding protein involved in chromosome partitioning
MTSSDMAAPVTRRRGSVPFLGEVPLSMPIRETSDAGRPVVATAPDGPHAKVYLEIAPRCVPGWTNLRAHGGRAMPDIVFE